MLTVRALFFSASSNAREFFFFFFFVICFNLSSLVVLCDISHFPVFISLHNSVSTMFSQHYVKWYCWCLPWEVLVSCMICITCTGIMQAEKELLELWENKSMWWSSLHSSIVIYVGLANNWPVFLKSMYCTDFRMELGNTSWLRQGWQCELPQDARKQSRLKVLHVGIDRCRFFGCVSTADCRATIVYFTSCVQQGWSYDVYHSGSTCTARGQKCKAPMPIVALASVKSHGQFDTFSGRIGRAV